MTLLISGNLYGQTNLGPKEFMRHFVDIFNEENLTEYKKYIHFPNSIISSENPSRATCFLPLL